MKLLHIKIQRVARFMPLFPLLKHSTISQRKLLKKKDP
jgi:hypothetical protein